MNFWESYEPGNSAMWQSLVSDNDHVYIYTSIPIICKCVIFELNSVFSTATVTEETDNAYKVLPWKANKEEMKQWLTSQGYGG